MKHLEQDYEHPKTSAGEKIAMVLFVAMLAYLFLVK